MYTVSTLGEKGSKEIQEVELIGAFGRSVATFTDYIKLLHLANNVKNIVNTDSQKV